jgi:glycosyltransferase involved in cell wall biosynthesis
MIRKTSTNSKGVLVLTTDLPYFPGKMGVDFFNLRHLAHDYEVGVVAPCYDSFPEAGVANLEAFLNGSYFWPRATVPVTTMLPEGSRGRLRPWLSRMPGRLRAYWFRWLLRITRQPADSAEKLAILSNCAPQLLRAFSDRHWQCVALIQTNIEPWFDYLPAAGGKVVYFHDVRSDYFKRAIPDGQGAKAPGEVRAVHAQEQRVLQRADVAGFVSKLDLQRANRLFRMRAEGGVASIAVDTRYYTPAPTDWRRDERPIVLFTGHLSHPPNVDAVLHFLRDVWPLLVEAVPDAVFQVVGMMPSQALLDAIATAKQCEVHANVPDIRPYFWNASAYVVPMRFGGGVRQKIFEAWSMKVPVVCTPMAAEGTGAQDGMHCYLEPTPEGFAARVARVINGREAAATVVEGAKEFVEANNSVAAAAPQFTRLADRAIAIKCNKPFKLLFDLRWMELGHAGGIEQATYELVSAIAQIDRRNGYRVMAPRSACSEWSLPPGFDIDMHYTDPVERETEALTATLANSLAESVGAAPILNTAMRNLAHLHKLDFDMVHSVAGYTHPDLIEFPNILTINDLQHLHHPEFFTPAQYEERERLYRQSAERASHIICISEFTRQDVHRQYGIPLEKMSTVWIVPSRNVWRPIAPDRRDAVLAAMGLSQQFLFFPAHCWPHKNHARLVDAFSRVLDALPRGLKLVLTGRRMPDDHPAAVLIRERRLGDRVVHLGYRSPLEIRALFEGCQALVFPSLFEGFGMPVAEAIISGKPVLCSNITSLPEIAGDAALTFDPEDVAAIGQALVEIATSATLRDELSVAALRRRNLFAARRSAMQTLSAYNLVYQDLYGPNA